MTTLIHIYGAPGSGKSTLASELFSTLKKQGKSAELVTEVAKDWFWGGRTIDRYGQVFLPAKQMLKETTLLGKVDYIITDSPFTLGGFYYNYKYNDCRYDNFLRSLLDRIIGDGHRIIGFFLHKDIEHEELGRYHSEQESLKIEKELKSWFINYIPYNFYFSNRNIEEIIKIIDLNNKEI